MPEDRDLEKQLKLVAKTGKYVVGRREVMSGIKGTKLLVWSASAGLPQTILDDSRNLQIPAVRFGGNPVELGRACGIPFRVSVIAVKSVGDADLKAYSNSADYSVSAVSSGLTSMQTPESPEEEEEVVEVTTKRKKSATKEKSEAVEPKTTKKRKSAGEEKKGSASDEEEEKPAKKKPKAAEEKKEKPKKEAKKESATKKKSQKE